MKINHHSYYIPGVVDMAVVRQQAERRRDKDGEVTIVHSHPYETTVVANGQRMVSEVKCDDKCMVYEPDFKPWSHIHEDSIIKEPLREDAE